MTNMSAWLLEN